VAYVRTCKNKDDKYYKLTVILNDLLFLAIYYDVILKEPKNIISESIKDNMNKKTPHKNPIKQ
jgi:hypothetical protein